MNRKIYEIVEMPYGIKMLSILPINETGAAWAYCPIRGNPAGHSEGHSGPLSCNIYKKLDLENGIRDFELCCASLGISPRKVITNRLTAFTNTVRRVDARDLEGYDIYDEAAAPRADGLITDSSDITLFHYAADCAICMFLDPVKRMAGILHASWKGSLVGIFEAEVQKFLDSGCRPADIIAVHLPCISAAHYAVDAARAAEVEAAGLAQFLDRTHYEEPHLNLAEMNAHLLRKSGLPEQNIYMMDDLCTYRDAHLFHSYRRGPVTESGLHLNGMNGFFLRLLPEK